MLHQKTNSIRTISIHQLLSERRFFAQFVVNSKAAVEELLPPGCEKPVVRAYLEHKEHLRLVKQRLPQSAKGTGFWWLESRPFFGGLRCQSLGLLAARRRTPRITAPRCTRGCDLPAGTSRRSMGRPAM